MYIDNLTIAGLAVALVTALLPLLFGREALRVREDETTSVESEGTDLAINVDCGAEPEPCR
jgi:hypothetical protein